MGFWDGAADALQEVCDWEGFDMEDLGVGTVGTAPKKPAPVFEAEVEASPVVDLAVVLDEEEDEIVETLVTARSPWSTREDN